MNHTATHKNRKKYVRFDDRRYVLYLNEQTVQVPEKRPGIRRGKGAEEPVQTVPSYAYTGDRKDGGSMIEAAGVTPANIRDRFIAGLIGTRYDMDAQLATLANGADTPAHAAELEAFNAWRAECKAAVDELLARNV